MLPHSNRIAMLLVLLLAACPWAALAGIQGRWLVEDEGAHVEIARCGDALCGTLVWLAEPFDEKGEPLRDPLNRDPALREREVQGMQILTGIPLQPDRKGVWSGGRIYDPQRGKSYRCTLRMDGENTIKMRGFLGISLLGKTTRWSRVPAEAVKPPTGTP